MDFWDLEKCKTIKAAGSLEAKYDIVKITRTTVTLSRKVQQGLEATGHPVHRILCLINNGLAVAE